jgi:uncharacterized protein (TIGR02391 family)
MATTSPFDDGTVEQIARIIGDTSTGYSGHEIGRLLKASRVPDPGDMTKWRRIDGALTDEQARTRSGNCVVAFVKAAMQPVRWAGNREGFGAVFEATKGLAERIREMTALDVDGHQLVHDAFEGVSPMVALNALRSNTEHNEQRGLASIMKGILSAFRNPEAHEPRILWHVREGDALDLLSTLSLIHRRLDGAVVVHRAS